MEQQVNWHEFWARPQTPGFHEARVNRYLESYLGQFQLQPNDSVFLPLCGKAVDILWLQQQGFQVIGVELSEVAVRAFFEESGLDYRVEPCGQLTRFSAERIELYQGNFMDLSAAQLAQCKLVYDRAALVAIEADNRPIYAGHMMEIIPAQCPMLLVGLDYDQSRMKGPPFSLQNSEVDGLYREHFKITMLEELELIDAEPRWRERGLESFREYALRLDRS